MDPDRSARPGRPPVPPRGRPADRLRSDVDRGRPVPPRRDSLRPDRGHPDDVRQPGARPAGARPVDGRPVDGRPASARARAEAAPVTGGGRLRGAVAVLGMFLVTLVGAGIDSFVGVGLGVITLAALLLSTTVAMLVVRRRDMFSVVAAPPLVFIAVAALNIALAPSAMFTLPTIATLLIRGFPTMAMAAGVAVVIAVGRLITRR
ncbi:hypothetical protein DQ239_12830 [Blastococcus sp. TF02-09]|uniref:DUF6542 domain-containing protein n=1 Tax=Blastococcus sp. TF02-09 TaxID=2250576 RepID=UPI000DE85003|nr:DUF6542 domain-containing protein [Blastococcus sp. TF02-9]RBY77041.1 hypothetical protein DQ239_12830 [Blastococcus sp. TF02-9]